MTSDEALHPSPALLAKLGSIIVHADEMLSTDGHAFDRVALHSVLHEADVIEWLAAMGDLAMIPVKRLTPAPSAAVNRLRITARTAGRKGIKSR